MKRCEWSIEKEEKKPKLMWKLVVADLFFIYRINGLARILERG